MYIDLRCFFEFRYPSEMLFLADSSLFRKRSEKTEVEELQVG